MSTGTGGFCCARIDERVIRVMASEGSRAAGIVFGFPGACLLYFSRCQSCLIAGLVQGVLSVEEPHLVARMN